MSAISPDGSEIWDPTKQEWVPIDSDKRDTGPEAVERDAFPHSTRLDRALPPNTVAFPGKITPGWNWQKIKAAVDRVVGEYLETGKVLVEDHAFAELNEFERPEAQRQIRKALKKPQPSDARVAPKVTPEKKAVDQLGGSELGNILRAQARTLEAQSQALVEQAGVLRGLADELDKPKRGRPPKVST